MALSTAPATSGESLLGRPKGVSAPEADGEPIASEPVGQVVDARGPFGLDAGGTAVSSAPLWVRFCEEVIAEAVEEAVGSGGKPGALRDVDWRRIWEAGRGLPPAEAVGRAVLVSHQVASELRARAAGPRASDLTSAAWQETSALTTTPGPIDVGPTKSVRLWPPAFIDASSAEMVDAPRFLPATPVDAAPQLEVASEKKVTTGTIGTRRLQTLFVAFGWMRNIGVVLLLFAAWQLWGTSIEQAHSQQTLRQEFKTHVQQVTTNLAGPALISASAPVSQPREGSVVAHLQIPQIGVDQYVVEGTSEGDLAKGPGHYIGTSIPGQAGNVAIAGHRTTYGAPFNQLDQVKINDRITLTTGSGEALTYVVSQAPAAVSPRDVAVLNSVNDNRLTLTTCNPKFSASQRLVVVALLSQPQAAAATKVTTATRTVRVLTDSSVWNFDYLPEVAGALLLLVLLGLFHGRARTIYGRIGRVLVVTPIWVAGLLFLFLALTKLLPANL